MNILDYVQFNSEEIDMETIQDLRINFQKVSRFLPYISPCFFILDYTKKKYLSITGATHKIIQYAPEEFLEGGIEFLLDIYQPDDFKIYNEKIFLANTRFLMEMPQSSHRQYVFSYNFRVLGGKGQMVPLQQRSTYITSQKSGLPLYSIGIINEYYPVNGETRMLHIIEKYSELDEGHSKELVSGNYYYPNLEDTLLTKRETEILKRMSNGLSSRQMAAMMYISENTVLNHRKNIMRKTNTKNVAELIVLAVRNRII
jgi:DNA-binding CsgD family transcriptional regulator